MMGKCLEHPNHFCELLLPTNKLRKDCWKTEWVKKDDKMEN